LSFFGFVPDNAVAEPVTLISPGFFLPFGLTFTGTLASMKLPQAEPSSRPGVFSVKVAGCDVNVSELRPLGAVQPATSLWSMQSRTLKSQTLLQAPSMSQVGSPSVHSRSFELLASLVPCVSSTT
jgi:hypothetical protein